MGLEISFVLAKALQSSVLRIEDSACKGVKCGDIISLSGVGGGEGATQVRWKEVCSL